MSKTSILIIFTGILSIILVTIFVVKLFQKWGIVEEPRSDVNISGQVITAIPHNDTSALYIEGNQIKRKDTGEAIILKGATSDEFRHKEGKYQNTDELFRRIRLLKEAGGNLITFWVTNEGYKVREDFAEKVVDFADENSMYVLWAPVEVDEMRNDLMINLANKFKDKTNVIYGLDAEPYQRWDVVVGKATKLGQLIRNINPSALLFLPGSYRGTVIGQNGVVNFQLENVIYGLEDYLASDLKSLNTLQNKPGYVERYSWEVASYSRLPILITEMGGVASSGFGSPEDLAIIQRMLNDIEKKGYSYQMHSIDSFQKLTSGSKSYYYDLSGLGMFDENGEINNKGKLYFDFISKNHFTEKR